MTTAPLDSTSASRNQKSEAAYSMIFAGMLMITSGIFHVLIWKWFGGDWEAAVSWRKPILFGISTGLTAWSLGWIYPKVNARFYDGWLMPAAALALVVEVAIITVQQWRGVESHFNRSTSIDAFLESAITWLVLFASLIIIDLVIRCFQSLSCGPDMKLAISSGMIFLVASILIGVLIHSIGQNQIALGQEPHLLKPRGVLKFPHGVAIHAIQFFPVLVWALSKIGVPVLVRRRIVWHVSLSMGILLLFSLFQTFSGLARFEFNLIGMLLLSGAAVPILFSLKELAGVVYRPEKS